MSIPWVTTDTVREDLAGFLQTAVVNLPVFWNLIVPRALESAHQDIVSTLLANGCTIGQIDAWDRREEFLREIALYLTLVHGAGRHDYNIPTALDRRPMLKAAALNIADAHANPNRADGVIAGGLLNTENDAIKMTDNW